MTWSKKKHIIKGKNHIKNERKYTLFFQRERVQEHRGKRTFGNKNWEHISESGCKREKKSKENQRINLTSPTF